MVQRKYLKADAQLRKVHSLQAWVLADVDPQAILERGCLTRQLHPPRLIFKVLHVLHSVHTTSRDCIMGVINIARQGGLACAASLLPKQSLKMRSIGGGCEVREGGLGQQEFGVTTATLMFNCPSANSLCKSHCEVLMLILCD